MLEDADGLRLADLIRRREGTSAEVVDEVIARIERLDPRLNMLSCSMFDLARHKARQAPNAGPFSGVPFLVKDLDVPVLGAPMSNGSRAQKGYIPPEECPHARAIREAGFVVVGKTTTAELGLAYLTNTAAFGPTRNPWDLNRNAGGSSGGSGAAVAARIVPLASSSDGGGSTRVPAAYCGVFGFKPSRGLNARFRTDGWGGAVVSHAITLTVRDSAAYLDWTSAERLPRDGTEGTPGSFLAACSTPPGRLRIGMAINSPTSSAVHADCVSAVRSAGALLEGLGHVVEECHVPYPGRDMFRAFLTVVFRSTAKNLQDMAVRLNKATVSQLDLEPSTKFAAEVGRVISDRALADAFAVWDRCTELMNKLHQRFDVILTPATATPPLGHDASMPSSFVQFFMELATRMKLGRILFTNTILDEVIATKLTATPFTQLANITGQPAMSVPLFWNADGLPIGVQFIAPFNHDAILMRLAGQLEDAAPWRSKRPSLIGRSSPV